MLLFAPGSLRTRRLSRGDAPLPSKRALRSIFHNFDARVRVVFAVHRTVTHQRMVGFFFGRVQALAVAGRAARHGRGPHRLPVLFGVFPQQICVTHHGSAPSNGSLTRTRLASVSRFSLWQWLRLSISVHSWSRAALFANGSLF